ncbi:hypothetical protein ACWEN6_13995 [Sphaerisporangium sp. NPDC004334]
MTTIELATRHVLAGTPGWGEHDHTIRVRRLAVANAPRPLPGNPTWQGEFNHGIFYAAGPLHELAERWHADDAVLLVELTPQAIVRKVHARCVGRNYDVPAILAEFPDQFGIWAHNMGLPWDDGWLTLPFLPAPPRRDAFTGIPVCEHGVTASAWVIQETKPGRPVPVDVELGKVGKSTPEPLIASMITHAAADGRADQYQIGWVHADLCRTADDPQPTH